MYHRLSTLGLLSIVALGLLSSGCRCPRPTLFPRCKQCPGCSVPMTPMAPAPLFPRMHGWDNAAPIGQVAAPYYGGGQPGGQPPCAGCNSHYGNVIAGTQPTGGTPVYSGSGIPHDSALMPYPTVMPPTTGTGTPKVELTTDPKKDMK